MTWSEIYSYTASLFYHSPFAIRLAALCKLDVWMAEETCVRSFVCMRVFVFASPAGSEQMIKCIKGQVIFIVCIYHLMQVCSITFSDGPDLQKS